MRIPSQAAFPVAVFGLWRWVAPASAHRLLGVVSAYPGGALAKMEHWVIHTALEGHNT